jgi:hypothetical protein
MVLAGVMVLSVLIEAAGAKQAGGAGLDVFEAYLPRFVFCPGKRRQQQKNRQCFQRNCLQGSILGGKRARIQVSGGKLQGFLL